MVYRSIRTIKQVINISFFFNILNAALGIGNLTTDMLVILYCSHQRNTALVIYRDRDYKLSNFHVNYFEITRNANYVMFAANNTSY